MSAPSPPEPRRWRPRTALGWTAWATAALAMIMVLALVVVRLGPLTPQGRRLIEERLSGLPVGGFGQLKVEGLEGDVWRDFFIRRLTISDKAGAWLEADDLEVRWSDLALLGRQLQVDGLNARLVRVLRRPAQGPKGPPSGGLPVSLDIRRVSARLQTLPAVSVRPGLFDVVGHLRMERHGRRATGVATARSLTHAGDFLDLRFDLGRRRPTNLFVHAVEAQGGAIAGSLGLDARQPFSLALVVAGEPRGRSGRLELEARVGRQRPAWVRGRWTAEGGVVSGRISLAASSLTRRYLQAVGSEAVFAAAGRRARDGSYGAALRLRARNLALAAQGPFDPGDLSSTQGLKFAVVTQDLTRLTGAPRLGAGQAQGLLSGDPASWRFLGVARVERAGVDDYALASVSGPVLLSGQGGGLALRTTLTGAGGAGSGLLADLAGRTPRASLDLERLKDGRLLIRKADLQGVAAHVVATGSMGLFGELSLKGQLRIPDLAAARRGGSGALDVDWSAAQASAAKPWRITANGRGEGFRTGLGELDRLLGPTPKLSLRLDYDGRAFAIAQADLDGAEAGAGATGRIDPGGALSLAARWRAEGPFTAGPVRISGQALGDGAISGTLAEPRADLNADFGSIDIPSLLLTRAHVRLGFAKGASGVQGDIAVTGDSAYGPAHAKAVFRFAEGGMDLTGVDADAGGVKAAGVLSLRGRAPSTADLTLAIGPGAILTQGRISGTLKLVDGPEPSADVNLDAENASFRGADLTLRRSKLTGSGDLARLPLRISADADTAQGPVTFDGSGFYLGARGLSEVSLSGSGSVGQTAFSTQEPAVFRLQGPDRTARLRLAFGGGSLDLDARQAEGALTLQTALRGVDLKAVNPDFAGRVDADLTLHGEGRAMSGEMTARLQDARSVDTAAALGVNANVKAALEDARLHIDADASGAKGLRSTLSLDLPVEASAAPLRIAVVKTRPMQGRFSADGEIQPLWDLVYGGDRELAGQAHLSAALGGTLDDPLVTGQAAVSGGRLHDYATGLVLTNVSMAAVMSREEITLTNFSGKDERSGTATGSGAISLERAGASNLKLDLTGFRLIDNDDLQASASGQVAVARAADGRVTIKGALNVVHAQINAEAKIRPSVITMDVVERGRPAHEDVRNLRLTPARVPPVVLDVDLRAPRGVFVKGHGINAELSMDAHVAGTLAQPQLSGTARVYQGSYDFAGKRFDFDERGSITLAEAADQIRLDLSASWTGTSLSATVKIAGTAAKPTITLTSSPSLPQDEILSQVLFGSSASQLSGPQTAQMASMATTLASGGGFDVLGSLGQFAGLDRLAFGGDQTTGLTVAGGKYVGDNVYVEIVGGARQGPTAEVDWRIRRHLSLVSQVGSELGAKLALRWTHDFGGQTRRGEGAPRP